MTEKYYNSFVLRNGKLETIKISKKKANKEMDKIIKENKVLFDILEKL